jgi:hypothetical protein
MSTRRTMKNTRKRRKTTRKGSAKSSASPASPQKRAKGHHQRKSPISDSLMKAKPIQRSINPNDLFSLKFKKILLVNSLLK